MILPGPLVAIVGPTASGKSALADRLAEVLDSSVVSVDAMQVYRGMDIGTAKVPVDERKRPLLMVDVADITEDYSVKLYQRDARACVDALLAEGRTPVLCGGTGLYLNAIVDDMRFPAGEKGGRHRNRYEALLASEGAAALHALLAERDPASAELIHPNNSRRVVRALEMLDEGTSYAEHHRGLAHRAAVYDVRIWGIACDRTQLYQRIDERVDEMFETGLVDEVIRLKDAGLRRSRTASQAIGYKEVLEALDGLISLDDARELVKRRTRHYAKRQLSWFRHDDRVRWVEGDSPEALQTILGDLECPRTDSHEGED